MAGKTRPLSTLVENQLPQFISDEYPQFVEFVKKYYEQLETKGQPLDIINNFVQYLDIDTYDKEVLKSYTEVSTSVSDSATTINVVDTTGFPESNGYILIDNEVIFYSSKTATSFLNCYRAISATTKLGDLYSPSEVTTAAYTDYDSNYPRNRGVAHTSTSIVRNISNLFLYAFVRNFQSQYLASFPEESLKPEVDKKVLIKNIKQFYKSKGTEQSIKFIFSSIIAKEPEDIPTVYYPKDFTIKPSGGEWVKNYSLKAKIISGNPYKLIGKRITQFPDPYDSTITNAFAIVDSIANLGNDYYEIILSEKSIVGEFKIASETYLTKTLNSAAGTGSFINVYSTLGWSGERGKVFIGNEEIVYEGKTINQFKILSRGQSPATYTVNISSSQIPVYTASTVSGSYTEDGEEYVVKLLILGVLYNLNATNPAPYSSVGDLVEQSSPGFITRDAIIYDKSISNVRWKINELFVSPTSTTNSSITSELSNVVADVSAIFEDANYYYIASSGIPSHDIGLASWEILKNQKQLRLIKKTPERSTEIYKTPTRDIGILVNGVTVRGYKDDEDVVFGGVTEINIENKGFGYKNPPFVLIEERLGITTNAEAISYLSGESVDKIVVTNQGSGYFPPSPLITITSGRNAVLRAVVTSGKVTSINIVNPGEYYSTAPEIRIIDKAGKGKFAKYRAVISSNGQIIECVKDNPEDVGKFYTQENIEVQVIPIGSGATATSEVRKWKKNRFYRLKNSLDSSYGYFFQNIDKEYGNGYSYIANPKKLRIDLGDNLSSTDQVPSTLLHSPILGYAYDGNPIYGPYGYSDPASAASSISMMVSSYSPKFNRLGGPRTDLYPLGSLIEDYQYIHRSGTLDENNGRFCVTPDYPNGTYAYFVTIDSDNTPVFPYIIGENYYSLPVDSNYTKNITQNEIPKIASRLKTPNIPSNGLGSSAYISEITSGTISSADIQYSSDNFSVNSLVEVDYSGNAGSGVVAYVDSVKGKPVDYIQNRQTKCIKVLTSAISYFYDGQLLKQSNSVYGTIVGDVFDSKNIVLKNVVGTFNKNLPVYSDIKVISVIVDKSSNYTENSIVRLKNGKKIIINSLNNSVINVSSNPFDNGDPVVFTGSFSQVVADKQYYVRDSSSGGFKISETLNGVALTITDTSNIISTAVGQKAKGTILERIEGKNSVKIRVEDGVFDTDQNYYLESSTLTDTVGSKIFLLNKLSENIPIFQINDNIALVKTSEEHKLSVNDKVTIDINPNDATTEKNYYVRRRIYQTGKIISPQIQTKINDTGIGRILVLNSGGYITKVNGNIQINGDYANGASQSYTNVELIFLDQTKCRDEYGEVVGSSSPQSVIGKPGNTNNARANINVTNGSVTSVSITSKGSGYVTGDILTCSGSSLGKPNNSLNTQVLKVQVDHVGISSRDTTIKLFSVENISVDDLLLVEKEIVKVINVNSLDNNITVQRAQNTTVSADHSNSTDIVGYNVNYRLSYPYVLSSGVSTPIVKNYDTLTGNLEVVYPIGIPIESISRISEGYSFYDQSSPRKLITISSVLEEPTYKFEFSEDTNDLNYKKNPVIDIQKYYIYKFDTSSNTLSGTFLEFSTSLNYNILTNESIKSSINPGSPDSYIKLKIGFGPSLATNTYEEKIDTNFNKFYYFDKSNLTDSEKSYINLIDDPLQGEKIVNYVTPYYFTYDLSSIPQWDGSGTISYTTKSKTAIGEINSISVSSGGENLTKLPSVVGIRCSQYTEAEVDCIWSSETQNLLFVKVVANGSGYSKPKAIISYGDGTEAEFVVAKGTNGSINGITLKNPGKNYTFKPTIKVIETDVNCYLESSNIGNPKTIKISANGYGFYNDKTISTTYKSYDVLVLKTLQDTAAKNLFEFSEKFDNSYWNKTNLNGTITANTTTAPDGTITADLFQENTADISRYFSKDISFRLGTQYTISIWAKKAPGATRYLILNLPPQAFGFGARAIFTLSEGGSYFTEFPDNTINAPIFSINSSAEIIPYPNGWYRCYLSSRANFNTTKDIQIRLSHLPNASTSDTEYVGDGTSGIYIWGAKIEAESIATPYIADSGIILPESNSFVSGEEIVQYEDGIEIAKGKITVDGYTDNSNTLKIITLVGKFKENLQITGLWKNNTAIVKKIFTTIFSPDIKSYVDNAGKYFSEKSILGINSQKISDSFHYQDYSYVIKSKTPINNWKTLVTETTHPAGFKVFGELTVENPSIPSKVKEVKKEIVSIVQLWDENTNHVRVLSQNTRRQVTTSILKLSELTVQNGKGSVLAPTYDTGETISYEFVLSMPFDGVIDQSGNRSGSTTFQMLSNGTIPLEVNNINNLFITLDGIFQEPGKAYTVSGSYITFSEPPFGWRDPVDGQWPFDSYLSGDWRTYTNPNYIPPQKFVGRFIKFKDATLNSQYFKKIKDISSQFDGIKTVFDLYYEDNTSVQLSSFENLLVFMDGVLQQNGITPVFPGDRSYYIKRTVTPNQIVFVEPPKAYETIKQSFYAYNVGAYERLTIDTEYIDDMRTGPFIIKSPLTNKVVTVDEDRNVVVFIDGVLQKRTKSYQIRGASITFSEPLKKNQKINIIYLYGRDYVKSLLAFNFETTEFLNYFKVGISTPVANFNISSYNLISYQGNSFYEYSAVAMLRYFQRVTGVPGVTHYLYFETAQNKKFVNTSSINFINPTTYNIVSGTTIPPSEIVSIDNFATDGDTLNLLKKTSSPSTDFIRVGDQIKIDGENEYRKVLNIPSEVIKTQYRNTDDANVNYLGRIGVTNYNGETKGQGLDVIAVIDTNPSSPTYTQVISLKWNNKNWTAYYENGIPPTAGGYGYETYPILKFVPQPGRDTDGNIISGQPAQGGGAEGYVITNGDEVVDVILTNRGSGYIAPPKIYVTRQYKVKRVITFENNINRIIQPNKIFGTNLVIASNITPITEQNDDFENTEFVKVSATVEFEKTKIICLSGELAEIKNTTYAQKTIIVQLLPRQITVSNNTSKLITTNIQPPTRTVSLNSTSKLQITFPIQTEVVSTTPQNDVYPSINEYGTFLQTSDLPAPNDLGYLATGALVYAVKTNAFPSSGVLLINKELITYTGKLSDRFTGCTRGAYGSTISAHTIGDYMRTVSAPV